MIWKTKKKVKEINNQPATNRSYLTCPFYESGAYAAVLHRLLHLLLNFRFPIENMEDSKRIHSIAGVGKENNQDQIEYFLCIGRFCLICFLIFQVLLLCGNILSAPLLIPSALYGLYPKYTLAGK